MSCGACGRRGKGRIVPVNPNSRPKSSGRVINTNGTNSTNGKTSVRRVPLRYTGR